VRYVVGETNQDKKTDEKGSFHKRNRRKKDNSGSRTGGGWGVIVEKLGPRQRVLVNEKSGGRRFEFAKKDQLKAATGGGGENLCRR